MINFNIPRDVPEHRKEDLELFLILWQSLRDQCPLLDTDLYKMLKFAQKRLIWCIEKDTPLYTNKDSV